MCGLVAMVNLQPWRDHLPAACRAIAHRGPDASTTWADPHCALGHQRLAVIDLDHGHQPMATPDGRYHLAYNGELYNAPDLQRDLEQLGHTFRTRSDTEVLLHALGQWGTDALPRLDCIAAFALWDTQERTLLLARDRMGIKPLFYTLPAAQGTPGLVAASELSALLAFPAIDRRVNPHALRDYLAQEFILAPDTFLQNTHQLEPGTWLRFHADTGRVERGTYWSIPQRTADPMPLDDLVEATDAALRESVRRQLVADVPVGVLFSGGIDSALLTHYLQDVSGTQAKTYTVKFAQSAAHDEAPIAARVAAEMGTDHHELDAAAITADDFRQACAHLDQPFGDASFLPVAQCCALARQDITVALGGDGGDELFAGYPRYRKQPSDYPDAPWWAALRAAVARGLLPASLYRSAMRGRARTQRHYSRMQAIPVTTRSLASILTPDAATACDLPQTMQHWHALVSSFNDDAWDNDALIRADAGYYLTGNGLVKTDRASMMHSLEARVPILGNPVVDLVLPQPASTKLHAGLKTVLNTLAQRHLPRNAWDRPKRGFTVPVTHYLCDAWIDYTRTLIDRCDTLCPLLNAREVRRRWAVHRRGGKVDWPVFPALALLAWLDTHEVTW